MFGLRKKSMVFLIVCAFLIQLFWLPSSAEAKWDSQSDNLPGISTSTLILIGVGVFAASFLILRLANSSKKKQAEPKEDIKEKQEKKKESSALFRLNKELFTAGSCSSYYATKLNNRVKLIPQFDVGNFTATQKPGFKADKIKVSKNAIVFGLAVNFKSVLIPSSAKKGKSRFQIK